MTALGTGLDGTVRRIGREYDPLGRLLRVTQYGAATGGSILNQVEYACRMSQKSWTRQP